MFKLIVLEIWGRSLALRLSIPTAVPVLRVGAIDSLQIQLWPLECEPDCYCRVLIQWIPLPSGNVCLLKVSWYWIQLWYSQGSYKKTQQSRLDLLITSTPYTLIDLTGAGLFYGLPHFVRFSFAVFDRFYVILPFTSVIFPHHSVRRGTAGTQAPLLGISVRLSRDLNCFL